MNIFTGGAMLRSEGGDYMLCLLGETQFKLKPDLPYT